NCPLTDLGGKTSIFSHPVYLFLREFSLQDFRGGSVQPLPSFTETQADELIFPSLRRANLALRRAKSDVQKWERVCAALRELNKHRDIVRQIVDSSGRIVSEK
uniref:DUF1627 domain-containing protein n=1 Tax=Escherichia coli TaxID=562 RepID=UPI001FCECFA3